MGGHGGLNILPQKRWNVYRKDNQEKVQKDKDLLLHAKQQKQDSECKHNLERTIKQLRG